MRSVMRATVLACALALGCSSPPAVPTADNSGGADVADAAVWCETHQPEVMAAARSDGYRPPAGDHTARNARIEHQARVEDAFVKNHRGSIEDPLALVRAVEQYMDHSGTRTQLSHVEFGWLQAQPDVYEVACAAAFAAAGAP